MLGPVFSREVVTVPRNPKFYVIRAVYVAALAMLMCTGWLVLAGTQVVKDVGDTARFGMLIYQVLVPLQLAVVLFFSAFQTAGAVAQEKDRRTLVLLLLTRMTNAELVLGKLGVGLLGSLVLILAALPLFMFCTLLGGISFSQVARTTAVTVATAFWAGSLGTMIAFWREKTFQTLASITLILVLWIGLAEAVYQAGRTGTLPESWQTPAEAVHPLRAVWIASRPIIRNEAAQSEWIYHSVTLYLVFSAVAATVLSGVTIALVRRWNPSRRIYTTAPRLREEPITPAAGADQADQQRAEHVDARLRAAGGQSQPSRQVWDNPVLWREVCTRAFGRHLFVIRLGYWIVAALAAWALYRSVAEGSALATSQLYYTTLPVAAKPLAPLMLVALAIVNALGVTTITGERDGLTLDLLLATDLTPKEFVFGKLGGLLWVAKDVILLPTLLCIYLWATGGLSGENLFYVVAGWGVLCLFAAMLGLHCAMAYADSRTAIGVSLGTIFFLFLGVAACLLMMISFSGSFESQMAPFLAFILGGGVGLYVSLGSRNPSPAIALASLLVPFATFYAITSFLLQYTLAVFLVTLLAYGFTTAAMMIPAVFRFDIAMGRTTQDEGDRPEGG